MILVTLNKLQNSSINKLIDDNKRFTITHQDDSSLEKEEESIEDVTRKIILLGQQCDCQ